MPPGEKTLFKKAIFPITTTVDKLCLFLTWEKTLGEKALLQLYDLKLLLAGGYMS